MTLLDQVLGANPPPFALLHRPESAGADGVDLIVGEMSTPDSVAAAPVSRSHRAGHRTLLMVPHRQITELGYDAIDDGTPLLALSVTAQQRVPLAELAAALPDVPVRLSGGRFDTDDAGYREIVRRVISEEIGTGEGANFVVKRTYLADITDYGPHLALTVFGRLLRREQGAYWTFLVHTGDRVLVGATPERHVSLRDGVAVMNPISGTYRYPPTGPTLPGVLDFLADRKETDELYMVLDEELKMMARLCAGGGRVVGPFLKEMARLAHTEYLIEGRACRGALEILRESMFAPTVTGSPLENACRVIARHESCGRGYYGGVVALIGTDEDGHETMDSAIVIRAADIDPTGRLAISVGATLVRHSDPAAEVQETTAKAAGLLAVFDTDASAAPARPRGPALAEHPAVRAALADRNTSLARFWVSGPAEAGEQDLAGRRVLVLDAEDAFTAMIAHQLRSLGLEVSVRRVGEPRTFDPFDLVVLGPGPGDPRSDGPRVVGLRAAAATLLAQRKPFLAVCLSHQVLAAHLGLELRRRAVPNQGVQRDVALFGATERVGFYNTFAAHCDTDTIIHRGETVTVARDPASGEVHALRAREFASLQFHAESILTVNGVSILSGLLSGLLAGTPARLDMAGWPALTASEHRGIP
ncbi:anthranilate synthase family protein [Actinokineospora guangxiensis]|uniref:anthranilate synthase n=1 Tax=Actinokineospora guangxiensis TaxID=1490288 RepID=A0ABW0EIC2_9PSEU